MKKLTFFFLSGSSLSTCDLASPSVVVGTVLVLGFLLPVFNQEGAVVVVRRGG
jgi:hypothetical protein